jgi:predicted alpha/beta superfamily hydrolase
MRAVLLCISTSLVLSWLAKPVRAQTTPPPLWTNETLQSKILNETRSLRISLPEGYHASEYASERYPVLFVLDAHNDRVFTATVANAHALAIPGVPAIPGLIIVGIETPDRTHFRDLTPPPVGDAAKRMPSAGGAPAFLRFLETELRPYIAARYRTQPVTILAGHSLSGAFAAWAFGQAPEFVNGAIALSPTPQWLNVDGFAGKQPIDAIRDRSKPGRLFVLSGAGEPTMNRGVQQFITAVKSPLVPSWTFEYQLLDEVSHPYTETLGMISGLRFIFRPVSLAGYQLEFEDGEDRFQKFTRVFEATRERYLRGARELGLPERLPFGFLRGQSGWYQGTATAPLLLRLCEEMITSSPTLWNGYDCAGDAQARLGRQKEAAANYGLAAETARKANDTVNAERLLRKVLDLRGKVQP